LNAIYPIQRTRITISGISALSNLYNLTDLDLSFSVRLKNDDLSVMPSLSKLRRLSLAFLPISSSCVEKLIALKALCYLNLWGSNIANEDLLALKGIKTLSVHD
jgi:hypothetical protein